MKPTLVILAAGMGSRYGGLKQLDRLGPAGETILEYSIFDAIRAGFGKVVFIIRPDFEEAFREQIGQKVADRVEVAYVFQTLDKLPDGHQVPEGREKPWGTGHALLVCQSEVQTPFAILNADDYYGKEAFEVMADFLRAQSVENPHYAMVGYRLANTLSEHGTVSRGICELDDQDYLLEVVERTAIARDDTGQIFFEEGGTKFPLAEDVPVSMNFWGFTPRIFAQGNVAFEAFLEAKGQELKSEFYIPTLVSEVLHRGEGNLRVLQSAAQWFGITYREDKEMAQAQFAQLASQGSYPLALWG